MAGYERKAKCILKTVVQVGLILSAGPIAIASNSSTNVTDGFWHSVTVSKLGSHLHIFIDEQPTAETNNAPPNIIQMDSDLFIGGIPS